MSQTFPVVRVFRNPDSLDRAAAGLVMEACKDAISSRGRFTMALSGGNTPRGLYRLLAETPYRDQIDWRASHIFWVDERIVPPDHQDSNYGLVNDLLLLHVPVPRLNVHRICGENAPNRAAEDYEKELRDIFGMPVPVFDLVLLGMGEDGHTASLFTSRSAMKEASRLVVPVMTRPGGHDRVTLTLPVLDNASLVLFLVTGREKADAVSLVLEQGNPRRYPAGLVRSSSGETHWLLDCAAASKLKEAGRPCIGS